MSNDSTNSDRLSKLRERIGRDGDTEPESETEPGQDKQYYVKPVPIPEPPASTPQAPLLPYSNWQSLGQPSSHDRRSNVPFDQRYKKENFMIDKRILPYVYHWIETNGRSKVDAVNRAWLKLLLADGYPVDPNILDRPFKFEDMPK
jgi:hypothetical protein